MLSAKDAVDHIKARVRAGDELLGAERFEIAEGGYVGRLDLILDLSNQPAEDIATAKALRFIALHAADNIMFEVVTASGG